MSSPSNSLPSSPSPITRTAPNLHGFDALYEPAPPASQQPGQEDAVLNRLISASLGPLTRVQKTIDMSLEQIADWIAEPYNRRQIANLVTLLDAQSQLLICQHRVIAVARLADVASKATSPETVRRACIDLLKIRLINPYLEDKRPERLPRPKPMNEEAVLAALEALGRADREYPPGEWPPPPLDSPPPDSPSASAGPSTLDSARKN